MTVPNFYRTLLTGVLALPVLALLPACDSTDRHQTMKAQQQEHWNQTRIAVLFQLAQQQYEVGDYDKARDTLKQALAVNTPSAPLRTLAAKVELEKGSLNVASDHLKIAIQIDANYVEAYYLQGVVYQRWQNIQAAHDYYLLAWEKKPTEVRYLLALAEMKITLNQLADAQKLLEEKSVYFEQTAAVRVALARLYSLEGNHAKAIAYYRDATLLAPEDNTVRQNYAEELYFAGRYEDALAVLDVLYKDPKIQDTSVIKNLLGNTYLHLHRPRDARAIFTEVTRDNPNNANAWLQLGKATLQTEDYVQAAGIASRVLKFEPRNIDAQILLAFSQQKQNLWTAAEATLAKASLQDPQNPTVLCLQGITAQHLGKPDQALASFNEALKVNPEDGWAQELLATAQPELTAKDQ